MEAENIIISKIKKSFPDRKEFSDEFLESNPYIIEESTVLENIDVLPSIFIYVLKNMRVNSQSNIYMQLLFNLNEFSKYKKLDSQNIWHSFNSTQKSSVLEFLKHLLHNQPVNLDQDELQKIIERWKNRT